MLLLMVFTLALYGTEYRVSTAAQVSTIMSTAVPGDTLTMVNGTWTNANIVVKGFGTSTAPILLRAETLGGVILTGTSTIKISGKYVVVDGLVFQNGKTNSAIVEFRGLSGDSAHYCRITNSTIIDYTADPPNDTTDTKWISLYGTHNRVDHCVIQGKKNIGTTLVVWMYGTPNYHQIDHNYFGPRPLIVLDNGGETIRVGTSDWSMYDSFTTVEENLFDRCNGEIEIISNKSCGNVYRYNTFVSCQGTLTLRHGNRCEVYGNYFFCNNASNSGGIRIIGEDHKIYNNYIEKNAGSSMKCGITLVNGVPNSPLNRYFQVKRALIVFNTLVDNRYSFNIGAGKDAELSLPPIDCVIANNLVRSTQSPLITYTDTPVNMKYEGNIFYGASLGITQPSGIKIANPALVYGTGTDSLWRITGTSIAIDSAIGSYPFVTVDMDGQLRTAPFDVGADEYSTLSILRKPLKRSDVGPQSSITSVKYESVGLPDQNSFLLLDNYPNPFNPSTMISYELSVAGMTTLTVHDLLGREVAILVNEHKPAGQYTVRWNASNVASGFYIIELHQASQTRRIKGIYLK